MLDRFTEAVEALRDGQDDKEAGARCSAARSELSRGCGLGWPAYPVDVNSGRLRTSRSSRSQRSAVRAACSRTATGLAASSAWLVPADTVVVAMYGATAGAVGYLAAPMATNQAVLALRADPVRFDQRFLFHWLRSRSGAMKARAAGALRDGCPFVGVESVELIRC